MNALSEQEKRQNIASELADIEMRQRAIVQWNSTIRRLLLTEESETLMTMAAEDEKNLRLIETAMTNFGMRVDPKDFTKKFIELASQRMADPSGSPVEKLGVYALAKQNQAMGALLVHKAAQLARLDVKEALGILMGVQASLEKQVAQTAALMEKAGIRYLAGEEPADGLAGRVRDVAATVAGAVMNKLGRPADEMSVLDVLRMDHAKVKTLFQEIERASTAVDRNDLFYQLRVDLLSHSEAEEQIVYRYFQQYADIKASFDESWSEHEEIRTALDITGNLDPASLEFQVRVKDLHTIVQNHVDREEDVIFRIIRSKADAGELMRLAQDFLERKALIQEQLSPHVVTGRAGSSPDAAPPAMM